MYSFMTSFPPTGHGLSNHSSAFSLVQRDSTARSFIKIRDVQPKSTEQPVLTERSSSHNVSKGEHEDSDSTHHSNKGNGSSAKLSKDEKRNMCLTSIMKLIESRKNDTLNEVDKFDDDQVVLKASPKIKSRNSKLSHFRGVSNNGRKWQVMIMGFAKKIYFGGIDTEEEASHKYDKYAILMHGLEAKTNYDYTKRQL
mmetsp:Transcript_30519/g.34950  ORF Transcript_30519/g.34950 Transcript_30519/m.34950 type:complete len:197 (+) Transcript_30519:94-684(+)|eukprot:CAMPEP_0168336828 /NCGR_PEP_ID=MMETSP0213-20121227/11795_1 /TAXON_ID=151035 /ORGANISM="Euplotes harpa, Strain FSP1.4" /LENGTH=196 /DNA_ID=CAMNT_0008342137 /DNA_START=91 /DNA_END=681 /DNA_ORIENTATION=-